MKSCQNLTFLIQQLKIILLINPVIDIYFTWKTSILIYAKCHDTFFFYFPIKYKQSGNFLINFKMKIFVDRKENFLRKVLALENSNFSPRRFSNFKLEFFSPFFFELLSLLRFSFLFLFTCWKHCITFLFLIEKSRIFITIFFSYCLAL